MTEILAPGVHPAERQATGKDLRALERQASQQREELMHTVEQIEDRVSSTVDKMSDKVEATQDVLQEIDRSVKEYRWAFVAGAVVVGAMIGKSRPQPHVPAPTLPSPKKSLAAGLLSLAVGTAAKTVATGVVREIMQQQQTSTDREPTES